MIFTSTHGNAESDIFQSPPYELIRKTLGFDIERVVIIYHGVKVHQIEAQEGLQKAMDWCREHKAGRHDAVAEMDFAAYAEQQR